MGGTFDPAHMGHIKISKEARKRSEAKLDDVGLLDWKQHLPGELSGGQRQRATLARALVNDPAIVWADEPTGNLDSTNEIEIMDLLTDLNKKNNQTFVIVSHSDYVGGRTNRIIKMKDGKQIEDKISVADAHPSGNKPFKRSNYIEKFKTLTDGIIGSKESKRFIQDVENLRKLKSDKITKLNVEVKGKLTKTRSKKSIF